MTDNPYESPAAASPPPDFQAARTVLSVGELKPFSKSRFVTSAVLFTIIVWSLSFGMLVAPSRVWHVKANMYLFALSDLLRQAFFEADEELVTVTCLTLWAVAWGTFFGALAFRRPRAHILRRTAGCALVAFVAWIVGALFLRHLFSVGLDRYFHIFYSILVATICFTILARAFRNPVHH